MTIATAIDKVSRLSCFSDPRDIEPLGGGITNLNLRVSDGDAKFVVRLGQDIPEHGVMRWNELALSRAAHALGAAPRVVHAEPGVLVLDFIDARTLAEDDVRDPGNLPRIVDLVADVHKGLGTHLTSPVLAFWPFQVNRTYVTRLLADGSPHASMLPGLMAEQDRLAEATGPVDLVIGHNDLLAANILDDGQQLWLIDWEYGGYNTPLFDLAGLAGNNGLSEAQERDVLAQYYKADPDPYWRSFQAMKCTSLMRETLWSMTSELRSDIDFDYAAYTAENMDRLDAALADFRNT
ncbi:MAG: phosphotransferase [Paracoccaceae bacterium]